MINKKYLMLSIFLLSLLTLSVVSASDNTTMDVIGLEESSEAISIEETQAIGQGEDDNLMDPDGGTFTDLQRKIDDANANSTITLENNYTYDDGFNKDGILISKDNITIEGNGFTIDANKASRIFNVTSSGVVFKNIYFINGHAPGNGGAISGSSTAIGCTFKENYASEDGGALYNVNAEGCTFIGNCAEHRGGGMYNGNATECIFRDNNYAGQAGGGMHTGDALNCIFTANGAADQGAAMYGGNAIGCTFENNYADNHGAAISNGNAVNCSFTGNHVNYYGGAIYMGSATGCNFSGNYAWLGGAIYSEKEEQPIVNCNFTGNWAYEGGAVYGKDIQYSIQDSYFKENKALRGGGIYNGTATNCIFVKNAAREADDDDDGDGGAMYGGAAYYCTFDTNYAHNDGDGAALSHSYAENCTFIRNHAADHGGAIYYTIAVNCTFTENSASNTGGAMYEGNATNCIFERNNLDGDGKEGGAIYHANAYKCIFINNTAYHGGAMHGEFKVTRNVYDAFDCTFIGNSADGGGAIYNINAVNCIFTNNTSSDDGGAAYNSEVTGSIFTGNYAEDDGGAMYESYALNCKFISNRAGGVGSGCKGCELDLCVFEDCDKIDSEIHAYDITIDDINEINRGENISVNFSPYRTGYTIHMNIKNEDGVLVDQRDILTGEDYTVDFDYGEYEFHLFADYIGVESTYRTILVHSKPSIVDKSDAFITVYGDNDTYVVTFKDELGPMDGFFVSVDFIGDKNYTRNYTADKNGQIKINTCDLTPDTYQVYFNYNNESYENVELTTSIIVHKAFVQITSATLITTYNSTDNLTIQLKDNHGNPITSVIVSVDLNGTKNYTTNKKGQIEVPVQGVIPDKYLVNITFAGNDLYQKSIFTTNLVVNKLLSELNVNTLVTIYNSSDELIIQLKNAQGNYIGGAIVSVDLNGTKNYTTDENGQIKVPTKGVIPDNYIVDVTFHGNELYYESNAVTKVIVEKIITKINADALTKEYTFAKKYVLVLNDDEGNPAANVSVVIDLNGTKDFTTDENGQINFDICDDDKLVITLNDNSGNPIPDVSLSVSLNGTKKYTTDKNGQIEVSTLNLNPDTYIVNVTFKGNEIYQKSNASTKLTINKCTTQLTANNVSASYGDSKYLIINLKDSLGNPVSGANVSVDLNGVKNYTTDDHGQINVSTDNLAPGTYIAKIHFEENEYCLGSDMQTIVDVKKTPTQLKANPVKTTYKNNTSFIIYLNDIHGHPIANASVSVDLDGVKNYTTDDNGEIVMPTDDLAPNNYVAKIKFSANDFYDGSSIEADVIVEKSETKLTANAVSTTYGDNKNLIISLKDAYNNPIANASVSVKLDTVRYYITNESGEIVIPSQSITPGYYIAKISFDNKYYISSAIETSVVVYRIATKLTSGDVSTTYNVNKDLVISLKDNNGNPIPNVSVSVNLGGVKKYSTDANGQIKVPIQKLVPKAYVAKISLDANTHYGHSIDASVVVVKKATPKITAKSKTFKVKAKTKKYTITLKNNKKQAIKNVKVYLKVKGKTYVAKTNSKGQATFKITKLTKKGKHSAVVTFKASKYYNMATKKVKIVAK